MLVGTLRKVIQDFHDDVLKHTDSDCSYKLPLDHTNIHDSTRNPELFSGCISDRRFLKQKQGRIAVQTWFGVVSIHSILVESQDTINQHGLNLCLGVAKIIRIHVEVAITPCMLRIGLFCSMIWNKLPENRPGFDVKLRVYNSVDEASPIIQACQDGNLEEVQNSFCSTKSFAI
jgi:hypothetical protein